MVDNVFIQCDYCKAKIRMRFQMGYFDIPFDFPCPECGVHIHGLRRITEEHSLKLNNAAVVEFDLNEPHYYADFSVELPHAKTTKFESIEKIVTKGFSPFLMSSNLYKEDDYIHLIADMQRFLSFRDFFQLKLAPLYDLCGIEFCILKVLPTGIVPGSGCFLPQRAAQKLRRINKERSAMTKRQQADLDDSQPAERRWLFDVLPFGSNTCSFA